MNVSALEKLNRGLHPIASIRPLRKLKRSKSSVDTRGRVFRVQNLHDSVAPTANSMQRNARGFTSSKRITAAHAPSMLHWMFHRCGIAFEETKQLVAHRRLVVDDVVVEQASDVECQMDWDTFRKMKIVVRVPKHPLSMPAKPRVNGRDDNNGAARLDHVLGDATTPMQDVPAMHRALHRSYAFLALKPNVSMTSDVADPRSFVHQLSRLPCGPPTDAASGRARAAAYPFVDDISKTALNVLRPAGVVSRMTQGLVLVTNDVSMVRLWNNEYLGNYGAYDVRFPIGAPVEMYAGALRDISGVLDAVRAEVPCDDIKVPCRVSLETLPDALHGRPDVAAMLQQQVAATARSRHNRNNNDNSSGSGFPYDGRQRLLIETPLLPYRALKRLRNNGAIVTCVKVGPFQLPPSLVTTDQRLLSVEELVALFGFEKRMKTNLMVHTLREFERGEESEEGDGDDGETLQ